jgi:predicted glycoside hydrolase/deacetylase ChbG (UPF0249 family)
MSPLILCADDFGYHEGVDAGIVHLVELKRISAVGCLITGKTIRSSAAKLKRHGELIDVGLHIALTELPAAGAATLSSHSSNLNSLMRSAFFGTLNKAEVSSEIRSQIGLFHDVFGSAPAFVDGHQHVHLLPSVRDVVYSLFSDGTLNRERTAIRDCYEPLGAIFDRRVCVAKAAVISLLAWQNHAQSRQLGLKANDSFRGVYDFDTDRPYRERFLRFLAGRGAHPLIMCHPSAAVPQTSIADPIIAARIAEFAYFAGDEFERDLEAAGMSLSRYQ